MKKRYWLLLAGLLFCLWVGFENHFPMVSRYAVSHAKIPPSFSGFRIAQISDLHNMEFGKNNERLIALLKEEKPDLIVITGDLVDAHHTDIPIAVEFCRQAMEIAPVYFSVGNHERVMDYPALKKELDQIGVTVLKNQSAFIARGEDRIALHGVMDMGYEGSTAEALGRLEKTPEYYTVLLAHHPQFFSDYQREGMDLIFSGHTHGGQFRLPLIGGLIAPSDSGGFFPEYDGGLYTMGDSCMIVSRGLGNSILPFRINNRAEIVIAELQSLK